MTSAAAEDAFEILRGLVRAAPDGGPKHARLRHALVAAIERGVWRPGARLPTEAELTAATPFSLGTVQRALRSLVEEGMIARRQGSGSVVVEGRKAMEEPRHLRFLADDGRSYLPIFPKVVSRRRIAQRGPWSGPLEQAGGNVIRVDRVISIAGEFSVFSRFYANAGRFGVLMELPLAELDSANFKTVIDRVYRLPVTGFDERARAAPFPPAVRKALGLAGDAPGLVVEILARTGRAITVYYQLLYIPPAPRWLRIGG